MYALGLQDVVQMGGGIETELVEEEHVKDNEINPDKYNSGKMEVQQDLRMKKAYVSIDTCNVSLPIITPVKHYMMYF